MKMREKDKEEWMGHFPQMRCLIPDIKDSEGPLNIKETKIGGDLRLAASGDWLEEWIY